MGETQRLRCAAPECNLTEAYDEDRADSSAAVAFQMLGTNFYGLRSMTGNQVLCTWTWFDFRCRTRTT